MEIELRIAQLNCIKANEEEDEVYATVEGAYLESKSKISSRHPEGKVWKLLTDQSQGPNQVLFSGDIDRGIDIEVKLQEEDGGGLITMGDDVLGGFRLQIIPDMAPNYTPLKNTELRGRQADGSLELHLTGAKAEYVIRIKLFEKVLI